MWGGGAERKTVRAPAPAGDLLAVRLLVQSSGRRVQDPGRTERTRRSDRGGISARMLGFLPSGQIRFNVLRRPEQKPLFAQPRYMPPFTWMTVPVT